MHFELLGHLYAIQLHGARLEAQRGAFAQEQASYVQKQEQLQASIQQVRCRPLPAARRLLLCRCCCCRSGEWGVLERVRVSGGVERGGRSPPFVHPSSPAVPCCPCLCRLCPPPPLLSPLMLPPTLMPAAPAARLHTHTRRRSATSRRGGSSWARRGRSWRGARSTRCCASKSCRCGGGVVMCVAAVAGVAGVGVGARRGEVRAREGGMPRSERVRGLLSGAGGPPGAQRG